MSGRMKKRHITFLKDALPVNKHIGPCARISDNAASLKSLVEPPVKCFLLEMQQKATLE